MTNFLAYFKKHQLTINIWLPLVTLVLLLLLCGYSLVRTEILNKRMGKTNRMLTPYFSSASSKSKYRRKNVLDITMREVQSIDTKVNIIEFDLDKLKTECESMRIELNYLNDTLEVMAKRLQAVEWGVTDLTTDLNNKKLERAFRK